MLDNSTSGHNSRHNVDLKHSNIKRCLQEAHEGHYGRAIRAISSNGVASTDNNIAFQELLAKHPVSIAPTPKRTIPSPLFVESGQVLASLKSFPKDSSPGWSQLRAQHLFDVICGFTGPSSQQCLVELTRWMNLLLSGHYLLPGLVGLI